MVPDLLYAPVILRQHELLDGAEVYRRGRGRPVPRRRPRTPGRMPLRRLLRLGMGGAGS